VSGFPSGIAQKQAFYRVVPRGVTVKLSSSFGSGGPDPSIARISMSAA
jgi:hypothetical protein